MTGLPAERNIFGRFGKLYKQSVISGPAGTDRTGALEWLSNVTSVSATFTIAKTEIRMAGDTGVKYRPGEFTGAGTLTLDKVNSDFEALFIEHVARINLGLSTREVPLFHLSIDLNDDTYTEGYNRNQSVVPHLGPNPNQLYEVADSFNTHEHILLENVQFWGIPLGFDTTSMISQDFEFTFQGFSFGQDGTGDIKITEGDFLLPGDIVRIC